MDEPRGLHALTNHTGRFIAPSGSKIGSPAGDASLNGKASINCLTQALPMSFNGYGKARTVFVLIGIIATGAGRGRGYKQKLTGSASARLTEEGKSRLLPAVEILQEKHAAVGNLCGLIQNVGGIWREKRGGCR